MCLLLDMQQCSMRMLANWRAVEQCESIGQSTSSNGLECYLSCISEERRCDLRTLLFLSLIVWKGCCSRASQTEWLNQQKSIVSVLEARSPKPKVSRIESSCEL